MPRHKCRSSKDKRTPHLDTPTRDVGIADLAAELDLAEDTIRRHIRRGAPYSKRANRLRFNVAEYRGWMKANNLTGEAHRPSQTPDSPDLEKARLRKENALAGKYERQNQVLDRQLLPAGEVRAWVTQALATLRGRLMGLGAAVSPLMEGRDAGERQMIVDQQVTQYLHELADAFERGIGGPPAAPASDADGMGRDPSGLAA